MNIDNKPFYSFVQYMHGDPTKFLNSLQKGTSPYYLCRKPQSLRIIFDSTLFICLNKNCAFDQKSIYLFKKVKDCAFKYVENNPIEFPPSYPVNFINQEFNPEVPQISTDINNAYWRISKNKGIIDEPTFEKGLEYKTTSLASLAVLGKDQPYKYYEGRELIDNCVLCGEKRLQDLYTSIRLTCYSYMNEVKETLASDFHKWKTDEVVYYNSDKNIQTVHDILSSHNLTYKDLILK